MGCTMKVFETLDLGKAIRNRRKELGYTQGYLSEYSGLSVSFISDVENGKSTVEFGRVVGLANLLGLDIEIVSRS